MSSKMSMSEFDGQQFMVVRLVSVVEDGEDDGEAWETMDKLELNFDWNGLDIEECKVGDSKLLE